MIKAAAISAMNDIRNDVKGPRSSHRMPPVIPLKKTPMYMKQLNMPTALPFFPSEAMSIASAVVKKPIEFPKE